MNEILQPTKMGRFTKSNKNNKFKMAAAVMLNLIYRS